MDERKTTVSPPRPTPLCKINIFIYIYIYIYMCVCVCITNCTTNFTYPRIGEPVPVAARLLGLMIQIPLGTWMSVSYECCVSCGVSECDREASIMGKPWPTRGLLQHGWTYRRILHVSAISYSHPHGVLCNLLVINSRTSIARRCKISTSSI